MKFLLIFATFLSFLPQSKSDFYTKVVTNLSRHSYYIPVKYINGDMYIIENDALFGFYCKTYSCEMDQYKDFSIKQLNKNGYIEMDTINSWFHKVIEDKEIAKNATLGVDEFLNKYFENKFLMKEGLTFDEQTTIIYYLFKMKIGCKTDCETGAIYIPEY